MRTRDLKPGFFRNEQLAQCGPLTRILFEGLWCAADRSGRLEDRPLRIKAEVLPYDNCDVGAMLSELERERLIVRYEADGRKLIWLPTFSRHQSPHPKEPESELPPHQHDTSRGNKRRVTGQTPEGRVITGKAVESRVITPSDPSALSEISSPSEISSSSSGGEEEGRPPVGDQEGGDAEATWIAFRTVWEAEGKDPEGFRRPRVQYRAAKETWDRDILDGTTLARRCIEALQLHNRAEYLSRIHPDTWLKSARWEECPPVPAVIPPGNPMAVSSPEISNAVIASLEAVWMRERPSEKRHPEFFAVMALAAAHHANGRPLAEAFEEFLRSGRDPQPMAWGEFLTAPPAEDLGAFEAPPVEARPE